MTERIPDPVLAAALRQPEAPAIIAPGTTVTWADLDRQVDAAMAWLHRQGLARGDRLGVYRPADAAYLALLLAAFRAGVVVCPLSTRQPAETVPALLDRIGCDALVAAPDTRWHGLRVLSIDALRTPNPKPQTPNWPLAAPATLVFTSGSTGTPKAALHTLGNHVFSALGANANLPLGPGDRWLLGLPLYHVGGLAILFRCVLAGAAVVLPEHGASVEQTVAEHGVTHASLVATQLLRVLHGPQPDALAGMKAILLGGSALPPSLVAAAYARGLPVHTSYGMTEMASTVTATPPGAALAALGTSGLVLPHREVTLAGDGEILVRGATLFAGYAEGETLTLPTDADGWFPTGDLGAWARIGGRRMLRVVGRIDNLFISGGENVQPEEIEAALGRIEGVRQAVVVPVPDAAFGQRPVAFVEAERWLPETWREALEAEVPRFKIPTAYYPWPADAPAGVKARRAYLRKATDLPF